MIPLRYGQKSELTVRRAAIETKDEHCDSDTNNESLSLTHTHHTLAHAPPQTGENPHKHTRQRTVNVFKCMAKQNGSTSCTLKKNKPKYNKVVLQTALLFPSSDLNFKRSSNYKKKYIQREFFISLIFSKLVFYVKIKNKNS